jgi:hypothetical protein
MIQIRVGFFFSGTPDRIHIYIYFSNLFLIFIVLDEFGLSVPDDKKKLASFGHRNHA